VAIVAADPVDGPRYGNVISEISAVWLNLLGTESVRSIVLEYPSGTGAEIVGVGLALSSPMTSFAN
jgi:hypothetical protein